tara:strand:+ start:241 stop:1314 length:1074 start_codon:yes stop_codon:yes gene_type:complete
MKKFDYYIIKNFLFTFGLAISLILAIAVIFDFSEKIDNFIDHQAPTNLIIKDYYINFIIHYGVVFSGLITFISVIFFTSRLSENNEIIALYNSKISPARILLPYMICAALIFTPNLYFQNSFLPKKNESRLNFENKYIKNKDVLREKKLHKKIDANNFIFIKNYDVKNKKGYIIDIQTYNQNKLVKKVSGSTITWIEEKKRWSINNYTERILKNTNIQTIKEDQKLVDLKMNPDELFKQNRSIKSMQFKELKQFIFKEKQRGNEFLPIYQIEQNERFSYSFSIFIFTLLGFLVANKKNQGGLGYKLTTGLAICFLYIFLMKFTVTFTINSNIPAYLTVWMPNLICLLFSILFFKKLT